MEPTGTTTSLVSKIIMIAIITVATWLTFGLCWFFIPAIRKYTGKVGKVIATPVAYPIAMTEWGNARDLTVSASILAEEMEKEQSKKPSFFKGTK